MPEAVVNICGETEKLAWLRWKKVLVLHRGSALSPLSCMNSGLVWRRCIVLEALGKRTQGAQRWYTSGRSQPG